MSDHQDAEVLRRRAREQEEIERQTDALVLRTLTTLVTASEDLKLKLRRDTEALLEGYRRTKRQLDNEIARTTAERVRSRREAEQERSAIVAEARAQAREIVDAAKREREAMLGEVRAMEQRLRGLEEQIRSVFGGVMPGIVGQITAAQAQPPEAGALIAQDEATEDLELTAAGLTPPPVVVPVPPYAPSPTGTPATAPAESPAELMAPPPADPPTIPSRPVASSPATAPAPDRPVHPAPLAARAYASRPAAATRPVELIFEGVPGYQQASALERALNDVLPDEEIDILQFEHGRLVLGLHVADLTRLAERLVAGAPASLRLEGVAGDQARFRCV